MKKLLLLLMSLAIFIGINGQKITNLTEATTAPTGSLLMVRQGTTGNLIKRITVDNLLLNYITSTDTALMLTKYLRKQPIDSLGIVGTAVGFYNSTGDTLPPYIPFANRADLISILRDLGVTMFIDKYQLVYNTLDIKPGSDTARYQSDMVYSLDSAGYWDRTKLLYVYAQRSIAGAKINWTTPGTYNLTDPGSTVPAFIKYQGFDADGSTDYLSTGWIPDSDSLLINHGGAEPSGLGINDMTLSSWSLSNVHGDYVPMGISGDLSLRMTPRNNNAIYALINSANLSIFDDPGSTLGLITTTRRGKTELEAYYNGVHSGDDTDVSHGLPAIELYVLANNNNGTADRFYDGIISIIMVMDGNSDADALGIYNIFHRYMTRIGQ